MKTEEKKIIMTMFLVVWVITAAGQTVFLEAANGSYASNPNPADGAVIPGDIITYSGEDYIWTKLIFVPGATAVEHTGYFSDNYDDVAGRIEDANLGAPPYGHISGWEYTFFAGNPQVPPAVETLVRGMRYYWCVDETDAQGTTYPGDIWEFTVQDYKACCPNPSDGAVVSGPDVLLSWVPGFGAEEHDVYFGTDFNDVNDGSSGPGDPSPPAVYLGIVTEPNILVTGLAENTWYYWRVDEIAGRVPPFFIPTEFYKGDVWSFKTRSVGELFVDIDADGANNGSSWADAFNQLQDALSITLPGDEIRVAQGTYKPDLGAGITSGDREATFQLINGVTIKGGYAGFGEPAPDERNIVVYETILSGDLNGDDEPNFGNNDDNSYHVVIGRGNDATAVLDGFTITAGNADGSGTGLTDRGGGIYVHGGSPFVSNCTLLRNRAGWGGGMFNNGEGGVYGSGISCNPILVRCDFVENVAWNSGGGASNSGAGGSDGSPGQCNAEFRDCRFIGNVAAYVAGGVDSSGKRSGQCNPVFTNCIFLNNHAGTNGGGLRNYGDDGECWPKLTNCLFIENLADEKGGGIMNTEITLTMQNCTLANNCSPIGAGLCCLPHSVTPAPSTVTIANCILWDCDVDNEVANLDGSTINVTHTDILGGWPGEGNISVAPMFADTIGRLSADSPCIDTGNNNAVPSSVLTDLDGNPRIMNGTVDMGAYEFQGPFTQYYHVDGVNGDNTNDGLTRETAFKTIQRGINVAEDYDTVLVWPGVYNEEISFWGDAITVKSAADAAIVETDYGYAFSFFSAEGADTVLSNFVIRNSQYGIYLINGSSPTLRNLTIVNNDFGISAFNGADPDISSCIFLNNYFGDLFRDPVPLEAKYSWLESEANEPSVPLAHWKLDEGTGSVAYDSAGDNDGILYGSPSWVSGKSGSALDFDGVSERDYVLIAGQTGLLGGNQFDDLMVEAWIKTSTINNTGPYAAIIADETTDGEFALAVNEFGSAYGVIYMVGSTGAQLLYGPNVTDGVWHHLRLRKDSSEAALFVDGNKNDTVASTGPLQVNQQTHVTLGCKYTTYLSVQFIGIIDEVAIYNGASDLAGPGFVDAAGGDYHLLSERGRYWPAHDVWVLDDETSPCIDGGDPAIDPSNERMPNGGRINMGAYGNTAYASMNEWPIKGDTNKDGRFNFMDIAILLDEWLEELPWAE